MKKYIFLCLMIANIATSNCQEVLDTNNLTKKNIIMAQLSEMLYGEDVYKDQKFAKLASADIQNLDDKTLSILELAIQANNILPKVQCYMFVSGQFKTLLANSIIKGLNLEQFTSLAKIFDKYNFSKQMLQAAGYVIAHGFKNEIDEDYYEKIGSESTLAQTIKYYVSGKADLCDGSYASFTQKLQDLKSYLSNNENMLNQVWI